MPKLTNKYMHAAAPKDWSKPPRTSLARCGVKLSVSCTAGERYVVTCPRCRRIIGLAEWNGEGEPEDTTRD